MKDFKPQCLPTAIGSLPHKDVSAAIDLVLRRLPEIPFWPQLPALGYLEGMCPQYSEGLPAAHVDAEQGKIWVDTSDAVIKEMELFYEKYLTEDPAPFALSPAFASGFQPYLDAIEKMPEKPLVLKGHTTGPITWGLTVTDQSQRAAFYNEQLKDGIVKGLARKAAWQTRELRRFGRPVIIFIDEPYLQSVGSSFVSLQKEEVAEKLNEVIASIHDEGGLAGIHCCGNTDWGLIANTDIDILNLDAYNFSESIVLYPREIGAMLERGGCIAWGIVPATNEVDGETTESLAARLRAGVKGLAAKVSNEQTILECSLVTPSCGLGSLTVAQAERALQLTQEISALMRGELKK